MLLKQVNLFKANQSKINWLWVNPIKNTLACLHQLMNKGIGNWHLNSIIPDTYFTRAHVYGEQPILSPSSVPRHIRTNMQLDNKHTAHQKQYFYETHREHERKWRADISSRPVNSIRTRVDFNNAGKILMVRDGLLACLTNTKVLTLIQRGGSCHFALCCKACRYFSGQQTQKMLMQYL